jgi:hypothetical protein
MLAVELPKKVEKQLREVVQKIIRATCKLPSRPFSNCTKNMAGKNIEPSRIG